MAEEEEGKATTSTSAAPGGPHPTASDYYEKGSSEAATETALVLERLETRRKLTKNSNRLVIVLVGLPARGKSFVARKLLNFLEWVGVECKIFNVGKYRRQAASGQCDANFFDSNNEQAAKLREDVAGLALKDMLRWLDDEGGIENGENNNISNVDGGGADDDDNPNTSDEASRKSFSSLTTSILETRDRCAIFDATNSTNKRRQWVLQQCTSPELRRGKPTGCVFVESICDDEELLMENYRFKISNSPDYKGMDEDKAMEDLLTRVKKYENSYETITDDSLSYIKIFNLSTKLMVNHIYGRMSKVIVPALMAWNIGTRPIFLCRPGQTLSDITVDSDDHVSSINVQESLVSNLSAHSKKRLLRGDSLGPKGKRFSDALYDFVFENGMEFVMKRESVMDMSDTGTSVSGLATLLQASELDNREAPFPLKIYSSTMPRAHETCRWEEYDFRVEELSNLNPLDKGDFAGKELLAIKKSHPAFYSKLKKDPFKTRFPGGESYQDLITRLESFVVDLEQQVIPTLVVSHVSVLQLLIAYFRKSPSKKCMEIEVPLHTVIKFTPARGGGWTESRHPLSDSQNAAGFDKVTIEGLEKIGEDDHELHADTHTPIWGDHMRKPSHLSMSSNKTG